MLELAGRMERAMFLRSLNQRITRPVMPDDEAFEYLPTQAIADFLATENDPSLDGIIFPSVQAAGDVLNVVLFHKAVGVETVEMPEGTEIEARTGQNYEEGWETEYAVIERVPPTAETEAKADEGGSPHVEPLATLSRRSSESDYREPALRIDLESIRVHQVQRVVFETVEYPVERHRWEKREPDF
jgi:RES domain